MMGPGPHRALLMGRRIWGSGSGSPRFTLSHNQKPQRHESTCYSAVPVPLPAHAHLVG